ncbi:MAG: 3-phosphoglycerate dehydrogenase, partial [Proteobacteria bacterium]|nr:3-phosphoglycerate dehydrogenase [Pseudomonadota bacterium]
MARIVFPDCTPYMAQFYDDAMRALVPGLELGIGNPTPEQLVKRLEGCDGVIHYSAKFTEPVLSACPRLRVIAYLGTGVSSRVDLEAAKRRGIVVRRVLNYGDRTLAEHTLALIFAVVRKIAAMDREVRAGIWRDDALYELEGKTLGLVGLGGIGRMVAKLASALGLDVIGWNRGPVPAEIPCRMLALDDVLARADIVSLHLGLDDETRGILDR